MSPCSTITPDNIHWSHSTQSQRIRSLMSQPKCGWRAQRSGSQSPDGSGINAWFHVDFSQRTSTGLGTISNQCFICYPFYSWVSSVWRRASSAQTAPLTSACSQWRKSSKPRRRRPKGKTWRHGDTDPQHEGHPVSACALSRLLGSTNGITTPSDRQCSFVVKGSLQKSFKTKYVKVKLHGQKTVASIRLQTELRYLCYRYTWRNDLMPTPWEKIITHLAFLQY